jgi:hypothetical protein
VYKGRARAIEFSVIGHALPGSAGVSPAPEAARMAALPGKPRQILLYKSSSVARVLVLTASLPYSPIPIANLRTRDGW